MSHVWLQPLESLQVGEIMPRSILDGLFDCAKDFVKSGWDHKKKGKSRATFEFIGNKLFFREQEEK